MSYGGESENTANPIDDRVLREVASGSVEAYDEFFRIHRANVHRFVAARMNGDELAAEEIVSETFLAAFSLAGTFTSHCSVTTWLFAIAKLRIVDHVRRESARKRPQGAHRISMDEIDEHDVSCTFSIRHFENLLDRIDNENLLLKALQSLTKDERIAIVEHYLYGSSMREIGQRIGRSAKGVECLLARAKSRARQAYERHLERLGQSR